jgi:hypothetical protein
MIPSGGFSLAGARPAFEVTYGGTRPPLLLFESIKFEGGDDGTRTFALAAWCAHSGDQAGAQHSQSPMDAGRRAVMSGKLAPSGTRHK